MRQDIKLYKHIVFGDEHYNPLGIIRSLGESGITPILIAIKGKTRITSKSKYVKEIHFVDSMEDGLSILLTRFADPNEKSFLYTSDDKKESLLDNHYEELKDYFIFFNAGQSGRVNYYMNKKNIGDLAVECGLNFLKSWVVKKGEIPSDITFPVLTKTIASTVGAWKDDSYICRNEEELKEAYVKITCDDILLQKYIDKKNEIAYEGYSVNHGKNVFLSIETDYDYLIPNYYSPYMTVHNIRHQELVEPLNRMFGAIGFEGIFEVEFLVDQDDTLYFGEINFRNSTWSYASTIAGMPLPVLWAKHMLDNSLSNLEDDRIEHEDFHAMVELYDFRERVIKGKISVVTWVKERAKCNCLYFKNKVDPKPYYSLILSILKRKILRGC